MMWHDFFEAGGWGMYPTAFFGFVFVTSGILFSLRPEGRLVPVVFCSGVAALGAGLLGMAVGIANTFHYVQTVAPAEQFKIATLGFAESLNNLVLALMLAIPTALLALVGAARAAARSDGGR
jgi:hypothetical protein